MKAHIIAAAICSLIAAGSLHGQPTLKLVDPLEPVYPDSNSLTGYTNKLEAYFPQGTIADVHLLIDAPPGTFISVSGTLNGKPLPAGCWSRLIDVPVEQNTGLDSRTEAYTHQRNPYVIRRAPFRVYDAIEPLEGDTVTAHAWFTALRLEVPEVKLRKPGIYTVNVEAHGRGWRQRGTFRAVIASVRLPLPGESTFFCTNWFNLEQMELRHSVARWSEAWFAMLDRYAAMMAHGRQNSILIPGELISSHDGHITLDEEKLSRFVRTFRAHGFRYFESPHLMYRGEKDDWSDPDLKVLLTGRRFFTAEGKRDIDTIAALIGHFVSAHGLKDEWLQHISDEPTAVQAKCYREVVTRVKSICPGLRIIEATSDRDTLAGTVDIWCPTIDDYQTHEAFFRKRQEKNEGVIVYTCLIPGGKWLNRLLDQERLRQVYFGWGAVRFGTSGYLHWGLNQYCVSDPFAQSVVHHPSPAAEPNNFLPAGDTHILYPGKDGPLSSTRFEAVRIGIEDYEILELLNQKAPRKVEDLVRRVFRDYTDYTTDVRTYRRVRKELLEAFQASD